MLPGNTTRRHNPEDLDVKHYRLESLKTRFRKSFTRTCTSFHKDYLQKFLHYLTVLINTSDKHSKLRYV